MWYPDPPWRAYACQYTNKNNYLPMEIKKCSGDFLLVSVTAAKLSSTKRHFMSLHKFGQHIYLFIHLLLMMNTSTYIVLTSVLPTFIKISSFIYLLIPESKFNLVSRQYQIAETNKSSPRALTLWWVSVCSLYWPEGVWVRTLKKQFRSVLSLRNCYVHIFCSFWL